MANEVKKLRVAYKRTFPEDKELANELLLKLVYELRERRSKTELRRWDSRWDKAHREYLLKQETKKQV